jgi:type VI protein secretion system component VasF
VLRWQAAALTAALQNYSSEIQAEVRNVTGITAAGAAAMAQDLAEARGETAAAEQQIAAVEQKYEEEKSKLPDWGIVLIISLCVLLALIFLFVGYIYSLEKAGTPLFVQLPPTSTTKPASGAVEMKNVDVHT